MQTGSVSWTWDVTSGCLGALTAGNEAMVRDTVTGARLGPGEVGEICVKGGNTQRCARLSFNLDFLDLKYVNYHETSTKPLLWPQCY